MTTTNAVASTSTVVSHRPFHSTNENANGSRDELNGGDDDDDEGEGEEDIPDDGLDGLTLDTFVEVPVTGTGAIMQKLQTHQSSLQKAASDINQGITGVIETAMALEDSLGGGIEDDELFKSLHSLIKSYIDQQKILHIQVDILKELGEELRGAGVEGVHDMQGMFQKRLHERSTEYQGLSDRLKYSKNDHYKSFRTSIWEINHTTPCPPMSDFLSLKRPDGGEDVDEDEDIEIGGQTMEYKCPITLMPFVNAVKSLKCVHHFSLEAIQEHIQAHPGHRAKCPVPGCGSVLMLSDLRPDTALQKRSDNVKRRLQIRHDEMEDDAELVE